MTHVYLFYISFKIKLTVEPQLPDHKILKHYYIGASDQNTKVHPKICN